MNIIQALEERLDLLDNQIIQLMDIKPKSHDIKEELIMNISAEMILLVRRIQIIEDLIKI